MGRCPLSSCHPWDVTLFTTPWIEHKKELSLHLLAHLFPPHPYLYSIFASHSEEHISIQISRPSVSESKYPFVVWNLRTCEKKRLCWRTWLTDSLSRTVSELPPHLLCSCLCFSLEMGSSDVVITISPTNRGKEVSYPMGKACFCHVSRSHLVSGFLFQ